MRFPALTLALALILPVLSGVATADEAPEAVNGLSLQIWMEKEFAGIGALPFQVTLYNVSGAPMLYRLDGERPPLEFLLRRHGEKAERRVALPEKIDVIPVAAGRLPANGQAWIVRADLRRVFGPLEPGRYTVRVVHAAKGYRTDIKGFAPAEVSSTTHAFEIIETSLEEARKNSPGSKDVAMRVVEGKDGARIVRVTSLAKTPLNFFAYTVDGREPLSSLVLAQNWTGRSWAGGQGGFCGTGLAPVVLAPGQTRDLQAPQMHEGIVRLMLDFTDAAGKPLRVQSEPFLLGK